MYSSRNVLINSSFNQMNVIMSLSPVIIEKIYFPLAMLGLIDGRCRMEGYKSTLSPS